jgi:hypothetical protein
VFNGFGLRTLSIYGQFRNKIIFYPVIEGAYVNTKNWYREETDLWADFGGKSAIRQEVFFKAFGKGVCGQESSFGRRAVSRLGEEAFENA